MDHSLTLDDVQDVLNNMSFSVDGRMEDGEETVRNFTIEEVDGKVVIESFSHPVELYYQGQWHSIAAIEDHKAIDLLYSTFQENRLECRITLDTADASGISVRGRDRVQGLNQKLHEHGINLPREFVWLDGASTISGVIELPDDDYDKVYVATDLEEQEDGTFAPNIVYVPEKNETSERPFYEKKDGKTFIYVNHFSGGGGTQQDPYLVATEDDLNNVRNHLSAYYKQVANITLTKWQDGEGFEPIGSTANRFQGVYDGQGYEIRDLYMNRTTDVGLFGFTHTTAQLTKIKLVNVNVRGAGDFVAALCGRNYAETILCSVRSGVIHNEGGMYTGSIAGRHYSSPLQHCHSHADVQSSGRYAGGLIGYSDPPAAQIVCNFFTGKVIDTTIAQNAADHGAFLGFGNCDRSNVFNRDLSVKTSTAGEAQGLTTNQMLQQSTWERLEGHPWDFDTMFTMHNHTLNAGYPQPLCYVRYRHGSGTAEHPYLLYDDFDLNLSRWYPSAHFKMMDDIELKGRSSANPFVPLSMEIAHWSPTFATFQGVFDGNGYSIQNLHLSSTNQHWGLFRYLHGDCTIKNLDIVDPYLRGGAHSGVLFGQSLGAYVQVKNVNIVQFTGSNVRVGAQSGGMFGLIAPNGTSKVTFTDCHVNIDMYGTGTHLGGFGGHIHHVSGGCVYERCSTTGHLSSDNTHVAGFIGRWEANASTITHIASQTFINCYTTCTLDGRTNYGFVGSYYQTSTTGNFNRSIHISNVYIAAQGSLNHSFGDMRFPINSSYDRFDHYLVDRQKGNNPSVMGINGVHLLYTTELKHLASTATWDYDHVWILEEGINEGYPELRSNVGITPPVLGFRNGYGQYYFDNEGTLLRYLEYGTLIAGMTSEPKEVWIQNNANFSVRGLEVWVDEGTTKEGITVFLSQSNNPFVPENRIQFGGTVPIGESRRFYVRFRSDVTVKEGGTFDLRAKAAPSA